MRAYSARTKQLMASYRALVASQGQLPEDKQWTMGPLLRVAKTEALVAMEEDEYGIR